MKKLIILLTMLMTFAFSSLSFAADGGDLNKEQKNAEKFMDAFGVAPITEYVSVSSTFSPELTKNLNEATYNELKKQVKQQFGSLKSTKFFRFERFDDLDRVTYIAEFSKEKIVIMSFDFNKNTKLTSFNFSKYQVPENTNAASK